MADSLFDGSLDHNEVLERIQQPGCVARVGRDIMDPETLSELLQSLLQRSDDELRSVQSTHILFDNDTPDDAVFGHWLVKQLAEEIVEHRAAMRAVPAVVIDSPLARLLATREVLRAKTKDKLRALWKKDPAKLRRLGQLELMKRTADRKKWSI